MGSDADEALFSEQSQELRKIGDNYRQEGEYKKALTAYERVRSLSGYLLPRAEERKAVRAAPLLQRT